jgi:hypothetical protein
MRADSPTTSGQPLHINYPRRSESRSVTAPRVPAPISTNSPNSVRCSRVARKLFPACQLFVGAPQRHKRRGHSSDTLRRPGSEPLSPGVVSPPLSGQSAGAPRSGTFSPQSGVATGGSSPAGGAYAQPPGAPPGAYAQPPPGAATSYYLGALGEMGSPREAHTRGDMDESRMSPTRTSPTRVPAPHEDPWVSQTRLDHMAGIGVTPEPTRTYEDDATRTVHP